MDDLRRAAELRDPDAEPLTAAEEHHVFAWISGYGWTTVPHAPYRFERRGERSLRVEHPSTEGVKAAVITPSSGDAYDVALEEGTAALSQVADVFAGPPWGEWRVTSDVLHCRWPEGFAFVSLPGTTPPVFKWVGPDEARVWIQGPLPSSKIPASEEMCAPGQVLEQVTSTAMGPMIELAYEHGGRPWRMFHAVHAPIANEGRLLAKLFKPRPRSAAYVFVVSAQTPEEHSVLVKAAVVEIVESLSPS